MKILIVSGLLGAGKTTFFKALARRTGRDFAVLENEYGAMDVDAGILRTESGLEVWELTENCVCCTGRADFLSTVLNISGTLDPEFLVVEPTGVARLDSLLQSLGAMRYERFSLLPPVTVADARRIGEALRADPALCRSQLGAAGTVVLSKTEGMDEAELDGLGATLAALAPRARIVTRHYSELPPDWWESLLTAGEAEKPGSGPPAEDAGEPETLSLGGTALPTPPHLFWFLDALSAGVFGRIRRAKGFLYCGRERLRFDVVDREWAVTGMEETEEPSRCVFIGEGLCRAGLREVLLPGAADPAPRPRKKTAGRELSPPGRRDERTFSPCIPSDRRRAPGPGRAPSE